MLKWDSHTHTKFCRHGAADETALMVEKAIDFGFNMYSITEHAPLPVEVIPDPDFRMELSLLPSEVDDYFLHIDELKTVYCDTIDILTGFEIDFLPGYEDYTFEFINSYESKLDDLIISLHFMEGMDGLRSIDYTPDDFNQGLLNFYGSIDSVHIAYWETIKKLLKIDFGFEKSRRIGHIGLINKFANKLPSISTYLNSIEFFEEIFTLVKSNGWKLEFNAAGMTKGYNGNAYLTDPMLYWCKKLDIEIIYGSDAHGVEMVGRYYDNYLKKSMS